MRARILLTAALALGAVRAVPAADDGLEPFSAHYVAQWKGISVGTSDLVLARGADAQRFIYTWRTSARGIFHLIYSHDVVQKTWLRIDGDEVRPEIYEAEDGSSRMHVDFDWAQRRARGTVAGKPLDLELEAGTQDLLSIQLQVMQDLRRGALAEKYWILDKDQIKDYEYRRVGEARIRTELGELDTIAVASRRPGGDRVLTMWLAPSLGFVPVQAERTRGGKLEFAMRIERLSR